jgi:uncharacterized protein involved in oxidation of intracellular sulfur
VTSKILFILNDPPYGTERAFNGAAPGHSAGQARRHRGAGVPDGRRGRGGDGQPEAADGYYHLDRMLGSAARQGADIGCCGTCMDACGITQEMLTKGTRRSTPDELADWTLRAEQVVTF